MVSVEDLIRANRAWAKRITEQDPEFFRKLAEQQTPKYLWIGCSDSRVPATQIVNLPPGEIFVHRNVANVVVHTDLNCLSVLQYAVDVLKIEHVIVCGHYGCGGVAAALANQSLGLISNWLRHVQDVADKHANELQGLSDPARQDRLCELNVFEQVINVAQTTVMQGAWERGQRVAIHGWVYRLTDGIIRDLDVTIEAAEKLGRVRSASFVRSGA